MNQNQSYRPTLTLSAKPVGNQKSKFHGGKKMPVLAPKNGHEKTLTALKDSGALIPITLMSGLSLKASVVNFDKYSIELKADNGVVQTFFKHAIQSFQSLTHK